MNSTEVINEHRGRPDASTFAVKLPLIGLQERIDLLKRTQETSINAFIITLSSKLKLEAMAFNS